MRPHTARHEGSTYDNESVGYGHLVPPQNTNDDEAYGFTRYFSRYLMRFGILLAEVDKIDHCLLPRSQEFFFMWLRESSMRVSSWLAMLFYPIRLLYT